MDPRARLKEGRSFAFLTLTGMLFHNIAQLYENDLCKHSKLKDETLIESHNRVDHS